MILVKQITTAAGKDISIYEDIFSYQERRDFCTFIMSSFFRVTGGDSKVSPNVMKDYQIYSSYSQEDVEAMGFFKNENIQTILKNHDLDKRNTKQVRVNCSHLGEKNRVHSDNKGVTLLYYANMEWELDWSGHTMFLTEDTQDCEFLSVNRPGRLVVFDGSIPHCILSPTILSPIHRFTFVIQYDEVEE